MLRFISRSALASNEDHSICFGGEIRKNRKDIWLNKASYLELCTVQGNLFSDGLKHWHKVQSSSSSHSHWRPSHQQSNPIDIEMTSYALLIHAVNNDFAGGMPIMKWITGQRNSNGGFASTQV